MKKTFVLVLAFVLSFALMSCGEDKTPESQNDTTSTASQAETSNTAEPEGNEVTFTLYNNTSYDFTSVSISKNDQKQWGTNLITGTLKARSNTTIKAKMSVDTEDMYNVLAKDANGEEFEFYGLDFSELTEEGGNISLNMTEGGDGFANFYNPNE